MYLTFMTRKPASIEISDVRKRLRHAIDERRRSTAARRATIDAASTAFTELLEMTATPLVQKLANALRAEGHNFTVFTPNGGLRMALAKSGDDFIEFVLDTSQDEPFAALRVNRTRGRRVVQHERPVKTRTPVDELSEEDVLQALVEEIAPFVER